MSEEARVLSAVVMNEEINKAIRDAVNPVDIRAAIIAEAEKQGAAKAAADADQATADKAAADKAAADKAAADAAAAEAAAAGAVVYTRTEVISGKSFTFESASELELERMVNNAYKVAYALQPDESSRATTVDPSVAAAAAQKAAEEEAVLKADLEMKFKRGEISAADYIEQSGAMREYLAKQGIPVDALKTAVEKSQDDAEAQDWASAVEEFKNSPAGLDWPGGNANLEFMGLQINARGWENTPNKVAALTQIYADMKARNTIFPGEDDAPANTAERVATELATKTAADAVVNANRLAAEKLATDAAAAAHARTSSTSSSLFGRSSGTGSVVVPAATGTEQKVDIPADATPQEIIEAWKQAQIAGGKDPNAAFQEKFAGRKV